MSEQNEPKFTEPNFASFKGNLLGTMLTFQNKVTQPLRKSGLDDERLNLVGERIKQLFDSIAAEMKSTQTFESAERREAAYKEMERYGLEASATIGCGRRPL